MKQHDRLCPWVTEDWRGNSRRCECKLIDQVTDRMNTHSPLRTGYLEMRHAWIEAVDVIDEMYEVLALYADPTTYDGGAKAREVMRKYADVPNTH